MHNYEYGITGSGLKIDGVQEVEVVASQKRKLHVTPDDSQKDSAGV